VAICDWAVPDVMVALAVADEEQPCSRKIAFTCDE
jgi:hypothetical protein